MPGELFISYSRKDAEFVSKLIDSLQNRGIPVWVDQGNMIAGDVWRRQIVDAISDCSVFLIVLSPNSATSDNVIKELSIAESSRKRIVPILYQPVEIPRAMEYQLAGVQYQAFDTGSYTANLNRLLQALARLGIQVQPEVIKPIPLPTELQSAIESPIAGIREGAVRELTRFLNGSVVGLAISARDALNQLVDDDSRRVSNAATQVLEEYAARIKQKQAQEEQTRQTEENAKQEKLAQQKAEAERIAREKAEQERLVREKAEQEKLAQQKAEVERIAREKAEQERLVREKAEQEKLAQQKTEAEWLASVRTEQERLARDNTEQEKLTKQKVEAERIAQEKAEQERLAREKAEQEKLARQKAEAERIAREKAEQEKLARQKAEAERIAREKEKKGLQGQSQAQTADTVPVHEDFDLTRASINSEQSAQNIARSKTVLRNSILVAALGSVGLILALVLTFLVSSSYLIWFVLAGVIFDLVAGWVTTKSTAKTYKSIRAGDGAMATCLGHIISGGVTLIVGGCLYLGSSARSWGTSFFTVWWIFGAPIALILGALGGSFYANTHRNKV